MKSIITFSLGILIFTGCNSTKKIDVPSNSNDTELTVDEPRDSTSIQEIIVGPEQNLKGFSDAYTIVDAKIIGNTLWIETSYSGGCNEHDFKMVFSGTHNIREEFEKGKVAYAGLTLGHNNNLDACRSIVNKKLRFDLTPIQPRSVSMLVIKLSNWNQDLVIRYDGLKER